MTLRATDMSYNRLSQEAAKACCPAMPDEAQEWGEDFAAPALRALTAECTRLSLLVASKDREADKVGDNLMGIRRKLERISSHFGVGESERDDNELVAAITEQWNKLKANHNKAERDRYFYWAKLQRLKEENAALGTALSELLGAARCATVPDREQLDAAIVAAEGASVGYIGYSPIPEPTELDELAARATAMQRERDLILQWSIRHAGYFGTIGDREEVPEGHRWWARGDQGRVTAPTAEEVVRLASGIPINPL